MGRGSRPVRRPQTENLILSIISQEAPMTLRQAQKALCSLVPAGLFAWFFFLLVFNLADAIGATKEVLP